MDTKLAPLIAEETARPHYAYQPFLANSDDPFGENLFGDNAQDYQQAPTPSPLLKQPTNVYLNFEADTQGNWRSPQTPQTEFGQQLAISNGLKPAELELNRKRLDELSREIDSPQLLEQLPEQSNRLVPNPTPANALPGEYRSESLGGYASSDDASSGAAENPFGESSDETNNNDVTNAPQQLALPQVASKAAKGRGADYSQREQRYQQQARQEYGKQRGGYGQAANAPAVDPATSTHGNFAAVSNQSANVVESISRPLWMNDRLLLARRIQRDGQTFIQGSWLDWPSIKKELLAEVADLFPNAELLPLENTEAGDPSRMLAGLPVEFQIPRIKGTYLPSSAVIQTTLISSLAVLAALASVGALLWGVLALSERRAAFVSSVTHELRTPLTTFRMYSEMLASGMVPQAERRQEYLETLRVESERLSHLVENVLSYARLERGRGPTLNDTITADALIERFQQRLADRAKLAGMQLVVEVDPAAEAVELQTDLGVVEQILFNLVDNAAKYASSAEDSRIHLTAHPDTAQIAATKPGRRGANDKAATAKPSASRMMFTVRDHGPGYDSEKQAARSAAFSKSAQQAAETAQGVGLGLALCRRLAKQLGGKLEVANHAQDGAVATLSLPT